MMSMKNLVGQILSLEFLQMAIYHQGIIGILSIYFRLQLWLLFILQKVLHPVVIL